MYIVGIVTISKLKSSKQPSKPIIGFNMVWRVLKTFVTKQLERVSCPAEKLVICDAALIIVVDPQRPVHRIKTLLLGSILGIPHTQP